MFARKKNKMIAMDANHRWGQKLVHFFTGTGICAGRVHTQLRFDKLRNLFFRRSHICGIGLLELLLRLLVCLDWVSPPSFYASVSVGMGHDIFTNMVFLAMRIAKVVDASFQTFGQQSVADPRSIFHPKKRVCLKSRTTSRFGFKCRHTRGDRGGTVVALLRPASVFQFARSRCALVVR